MFDTYRDVSIRSGERERGASSSLPGVANPMSRGMNKERELLGRPKCEIQIEELQDVQTRVCILLVAKHCSCQSRDDGAVL